MNKSFLFTAIIGIVLLSSCGTQTPAATTDLTDNNPSTSATDQPTVAQNTPNSPNDVISFSSDVLPILEANCTRCHGNTRQSADLELDSYVNIMAGSESGAVIVPGDTENSLLMVMIVSGAMPKAGSNLSDNQIDTIRMWIEAGALDN